MTYQQIVSRYQSGNMSEEEWQSHLADMNFRWWAYQQSMKE